MNNHFLPMGNASKFLLIINVCISLIYISWWFEFKHIGNPILYFLLFIGEIYHVIMALSFWFTVWPTQSNKAINKHILIDYLPTADIFITVAGEPIEIVEHTIQAVLNMKYPYQKIFILNDGKVSGSENWQEIEKLAKKNKINCITRSKGGGAKAGNINNALKKTNGEIVVVFDADMSPYPQFMNRILPYFQNENVSFVQTPQFYKNSEENEVTEGAWDQQKLFFGTIMSGKNRSNSAFICGTNFGIRRKSLEQIGGMCEDNIAEDFLTSLSIHQNGWKSHYISEILSEGLAPSDILSYYKQQLRWARGSLEVLFGSNPFMKKGLSISQKVQYASSALYYLNGLILLIDMLMPLFFLFFGIEPVASTTTSFAIFFIPYMFLNLYTLYITTGHSLTFKALSFSQSSWTIQLQALKSVLLKQKMSFSITPKKTQEGNFLFLAYPHIFYTILVIFAIIFGIIREGLNPSVITNLAWAVFNVSLFIPFIHASYNWNALFHIPTAIKENYERV